MLPAKGSSMKVYMFIYILFIFSVVLVLHIFRFIIYRDIALQ